MNTHLLLHVAIVAFFAMMVGFVYQIKSKNAGVVDVLWSFGIMFACLYFAFMNSGHISIRLLVAVLSGAWFCRLGSHILLRMLSEKEDGRYAYVRELYGAKVNRFHFFFFTFQAGLVVLFSFPMWFVTHHPQPSTLAMIVAVLIVVIAFIGEHQADHQLHLFRSDPDNRGKTCQQGLWKYSRHPNYFFEWLHWFAYPILAIGMPNSAWLWLAPVCMFLFLWYVTGIPFTEKQALKSRGESYRKYQQTTSAFFPWPPIQL